MSVDEVMNDLQTPWREDPKPQGESAQNVSESDLISRKAAIDVIIRALIRATTPINNGDGTCTITPLTSVVIRKVLNELPSIQPEQRWIPCSERLPEDYVDVLVWFEYFRYGNYNCLYQTFGIGDYSEEYGSWMVNHESGWRKLRVIAWMPLPEPYEGDTQ